jgi:hypothetical protein
MKTTKIELDVDFIGEQNGLTMEEEKALNEFFKQRKLTTKSSKKRNQSSSKSNRLQL